MSDLMRDLFDIIEESAGLDTFDAESLAEEFEAELEDEDDEESEDDGAPGETPAADGRPTCTRCGKTWPRDPSLEVECPTCHAQPGRRCTVLRPSEHRHSAAFAGLPDWGHDARDLAAAAANAYGCGCGISPEEAARRLSAMLTAPAGSKGRTHYHGTAGTLTLDL